MGGQRRKRRKKIRGSRGKLKERGIEERYGERGSKRNGKLDDDKANNGGKNGKGKRLKRREKA